MKIPVFGLDGSRKSEISAVKAFSEPVRPDLIKRSVLAEQSLRRQAYGADPMAGKRTSAHYHGRRGIRNSMMNREMARMKRIHSTGHLYMRARFVPQATKGRKAHPPKAEKVWRRKINAKEWDKAFMSALAATADGKLVIERGHITEGTKHIPIVVDDKLQEIKRNKDVSALLVKLGLEREMERTRVKKVRAGKGTARNRKYKRKTGPLIIVSEDKGIAKAGRNIAGVDVVTVNDLTVELLAPGTQPGRLCIWSQSALQGLEK